MVRPMEAEKRKICTHVKLADEKMHYIHGTFLSLLLDFHI